MSLRTVEKVGGTTMSRLPELVDPLFRAGDDVPMNRLFVVSAYGGVTDLLLEHKHSGDPGVYGLFSEGENDDEWQDQLSDVHRHLQAINAAMFGTSHGRARADRFLSQRIDDVRECLLSVRQVCSFGPFDLASYLGRVRELLSSLGEAHSAWNTAAILREQGLPALLRG